MLLKFLVGVLGAAAAVVSCSPSPAPCSVVWGNQRIAGHETADGVCRYSVRYAKSSRWENSVAVADAPDADGVPPLCPQRETPFGRIPGTTTFNAVSEDCLYAYIYAPKNARGLPVLTWIHGGGDVGGAVYPGVEGSYLAKNGKMIVVVPQYRLGALGLLPPLSASTSGDPNLAVKDLILALRQVQSRIGVFGGDTRRVTLAGHSSGGQMVRALLAAPAAKGLFHRAILQSDPLFYGLSPPAITTALQGQFYSTLNVSRHTTLQDLRSAPLADIIGTQAVIQLRASQNQIPGVPLTQAFRPTFSTNTIPNNPMDSLWNNPSALAFNPSNVPLLITTVANEGGDLTHTMFNNAVPLIPQAPGIMLQAVSAAVGPQRANTLVNTAPYALPATSDDPEAFRSHLERTITDLVWRCATRATAQKWAAAGGKVFIGEWNKGTKFPNNIAAKFCNGKVCHQDDVFPTFGSSSQTDAALQSEVLESWSSFIRDGTPANWAAFPASGGVDGAGVKAIGGGSVPACPEGVFGNTVQWDWQIYV